MTTSTALSWIVAIEEATECLRNRDAGQVDACLSYLEKLEREIRRLKEPREDGRGENVTTTDDAVDQWDLPPTTNPPPWHDFLQSYFASDDNSQYQHSFSRDERRFQEAKSPCNDKSNYVLDCRRILIRVLTSQSDCLAMKARLYQQKSQHELTWKVGADQLTYSLGKIHAALDLADTQISKWISKGEHDFPASFIHQNKDHSAIKGLKEDANIVSVSIQSLTEDRDTFLQCGRKEEAFLLRKLQPEWESRDAVKSRWGDAKWKNNPNPKFDFAKKRGKFEKRYRDVQAALEVLQGMHLNLMEAAEKTRLMKNQLVERSTDDIDQDEVLLQSQRYNGIRPDYIVLQNRVSWDDYPDPTEFGWMFTGSWNMAEFFEKDGVKLDWYFTTATVKTALDHPSRGRTQMFRKHVNPGLYRNILENPRVHTNQGYQRRRNAR